MTLAARLASLRLPGNAAIRSAIVAAAFIILAGVAIRTWPVGANADRPANHGRAASPRAAAPPVPVEQIAADAPMAAQGEQAKRLNQQQPIVRGGLEAAPAFRRASADVPALAQAQACLAAAMYYEAGFEGADGRLAVGQVVLNRVRHPAFPHEVCAVVFERSNGSTCQFTFFCDGALSRPPVPAIWRQAMAEAATLLAGRVYAPVGMATHYHADYVLPYWAPRLDKIAVIGAHIFYRWPGQWGRRGAFNAAYAGREPSFAGIMGIRQLAAQGDDAPATDTAAEPSPPIRVSEREGGYVDPAFGWVPRISQGAAANAASLADKTD